MPITPQSINLGLLDWLPLRWYLLRSPIPLRLQHWWTEASEAENGGVELSKVTRGPLGYGQKSSCKISREDKNSQGEYFWVHGSHHRGGGAVVSAADSFLLIVRLLVRVWLWVPMIHCGERRWCSAKDESYLEPMQPPVHSVECTKNCIWVYEG